MNDRPLRSLLLAELEQAGIDLPEEAVERLVAHAHLLVKWNKAVRLVGSADAETLVRRHILESLALLPFIHEPRGGLLDIGSGNGYPAIPLKCALPDLRLTMMEPTMRKAVFLRTVAADLRLTDVEVVRDRVDRPADLARYGKWDCITMRAVAGVPMIMAGAVTALRTAGRLLFLVGEAGRTHVLRGLRADFTVLADVRLPDTKASYLVVVGQGRVIPSDSLTVH